MQMSDNVFATTATGWNIGFHPVRRTGVLACACHSKFRRARVRPDWHYCALLFALGLQCLFDLAQWQTIHDIPFC
jgi:hypothetical protein